MVSTRKPPHHGTASVRDQWFSDLWRRAEDERLAALRRWPAGLPSRCRGCRFLDICNGNLRTRAEVATGDWLGMNPACYLRDAEIAPSSLAGAETVT